MRLSALLIERYGCFDRALVPLDPRPGRINLVLAPNGAGKSVLRQAFHDLLFGIPMQSPMKFRFDYPDMHLHADAVDEDGTRFGFGWRRRGARTFAEPSEEARRRFGAVHGRITPAQVEYLFALDTQRLREGGSELAAGGDRLGVALLSGSGEFASARAVRAGLEARRAVLWKPGPNSRSGALHAAVKTLESARKAFSQAVEPPRRLQDLEAAIEVQAGLHRAAEQAYAQARAQDRRLTRIGRTRPLLAARDAALAWLEANRNIAALPPGLAEAVPKAAADAGQASALLHERQAAASRDAAGAAGIVRHPEVLALEDRLAGLAERLGRADSQQTDIPKVEREQREAEVEVAAALRDLGADLPPDQALSLVPQLALVERAQRLIQEHVLLGDSRVQAAGRLDEAERTLALLEEEQDDEAACADPALLPALLRDARADGDPRRLADAAAVAVQAAEARVAACLARIPCWRGDLAALLALAPPGESHFAGLDEVLEEAVSASRKALAALAGLEEEHAGLREQVEALKGANVPDRRSLAAAREARDQSWSHISQLLSRAGTSHSGVEAKGETRHGGDSGTPLLLTFERQLRLADAIADRITADVARVEEQARLAEVLMRAGPALEVLRAAAAAAAMHLAAAQGDWAAACAPLQLPANSGMPELRHALSTRLEAIAAHESATAARAAEAALGRSHAAAARRLATQLGCPVAPLAQLLVDADLTVAARARQATQAADRAAQRREATRTRAKERHALDLLEQKLQAWDKSWSEVLQALGRPGGEDAETTRKILPRLDDLRLHAQEASGKAVRVRDMRAELASFEAEVDVLTGALGMDGGADRLAAARSLIRRREEAARQETRWAAAEAALVSSRDAAVAAEQAERDAVARLARLLDACGAATVAEAELRLDEAAQRRDREHMANTAEQALAQEGGVGIAALAEESAQAERDLEAARDVVDAALEAARKASEDARLGLDQLETRLAGARASTTATEASAAQEAAAAVVARLLDEELTLRLAISMLAQAMEAVEKDAGGAAVARISNAFASVTGGAYRLTAGEDRGRPTLRAVELLYPKEVKAIADLSEGTRDQLYLALRLVAIADHVAFSPRLPFIADDILQTFDDTRALASFEALRTLSETVQVIVLTHHAHLVEIARQLPMDTVHVHHLAQSA